MLLKKDAKFIWTDECQNAFEKLKESLITKPVLHLYDPDLTCHVFVDISQKSVGAVLKQLDASNVLHPIAYHSITLREYEKNYAITELECLAIIDALDKFYYYLHDQKFIIHTDHAALVWLKSVKNLRGRLFRWSLKLSMYDNEIKYLKGSTNIEADMLSRHPVAHHLQHSSHLLDINEVKTHRKNDNLCGPKYHEIKDVIGIKKKILHKIVIPFSLRLKLLNQAHEQFGHPGVQKMLNLISLQYYWLNITTDISEFVKHCMVSHHPQTNGKNERVNQSLVTRLKCKVNASSTKIPWTKLLYQVYNEYNSTPHSITKYPPAYLLFGLLPYQSPIDQNNYYEPVDEARELAFSMIILPIDYHTKNKIRSDVRCFEKNSTQMIL
ncbi:hypothetical protein TNCV_981251 [Trichonephila clavipes]|uniref:RNA-directed DNA polymerase n=1 Tax=Trichonephila clavipes TaxID=2585209 RepID=A0A8X6S211_TRICX|nr:hypothetical protein TNCV_981251 [Trichonephila clavipes]